MNLLKSIPFGFQLHQLHGIAVHFPIALLFMSVLFYIFARAKESKPLELIAVGNLVAGALLAWIAVLSGHFASDHAPNQTAAIHDVLELHEQLGTIVAGYFTLMALWGFFAYRKQGSKIIPLFLILLLLGSAALGFQGYLGGYMVYDAGVGVKAATAPSQAPKSPPPEGRENHEQKQPQTSVH